MTDKIIDKGEREGERVFLSDGWGGGQVADFGIAKLLPDNRTTEVTKILGTDGYLEPEYRDTGTIATGIDVYAYGIILLELITGKKPILEGDGRIVHLKVWVSGRSGRSGKIGKWQKWKKWQKWQKWQKWKKWQKWQKRQKWQKWQK